MSEPLFGCRESGCAEEVSYPVDMLHVFDGEAWCEGCWIDNQPDHSPRWYELPNFVPEADKCIAELEAEVERLREVLDWSLAHRAHWFPAGRFLNYQDSGPNGRFQNRISAQTLKQALNKAMP